MNGGAVGAVQLRRATLDDVEAIVAIERASFSDPWSARSFRELLGQGNVLCEVAVRAAPSAFDEAPSSTSDRGGNERSASSAAANPSAAVDAHASVVSRATEVVGFAVIYLAGREGDLANLATAASVRRSGVGRRLLEHILEEARTRGAVTIFLEVRESNVAARALYRSAGFVDVGRRKKYYARPVEDALVLRKELS